VAHRACLAIANADRGFDAASHSAEFEGGGVEKMRWRARARASQTMLR